MRTFVGSKSLITACCAALVAGTALGQVPGGKQRGNTGGSSSDPVTLMVDNQDPDCSDVDGAPYCTIQAAIDSAQPGDTVQVMDGTYTEHLVITTDDLQVLGGISLPEIVGTEQTAGVTITASGVTFAGFTVRDSDVGILMSDTKETRISACEVFDNASDGIRLAGEGSSVTDNEVYDNGDDGIQLGDGILFTKDCEISENDVHGNANEGIRLYYAQDNLITDNSCIQNLSDGIRADYRSATNDLQENFCEENGHDGLEVDGAFCQVEDNSVVGDGSSDGYEIDGDINVVTDNQAVFFRDGFDLDGEMNELEADFADANIASGFDINGSKNYLVNCVGKRAIYGFQLDRGAFLNILEGCLADQSRVHGFLIGGTLDNLLTGNVAQKSAQDGFHADWDAVINLFESNLSKKNAWGYGDESEGDGTLGTANLYADNECSDNSEGSSYPDGLCD